MKIFEKNYSDESLIDLPEDVWDAINDSPDVPEPEDNGFTRGTFKVTVEWIDDEE